MDVIFVISTLYVTRIDEAWKESMIMTLVTLAYRNRPKFQKGWQIRDTLTTHWATLCEKLFSTSPTFGVVNVQ